MTTDPITFLRREKCGMDPEGPPCSANWQLRNRVPDHESHLGTYDVLYCSKCKMGLTDPYPSEETTGLLYETKSSGDFDVIQDTIIDRLKDVLARRLLRKISPYPDPAQVTRVLDYSCGNARFAGLAHDFFPQAQVDAVDYQARPPALVLAGTRSRLNYHEVNAFRASDRAYDLIILRHALEHTHRPVDLVRFLGSRLTSQGVLYIEVPNLFSGGERVFGSNWKGYYVPRHIFHYTPDSLRQIITIAGLEGTIEGNEMPLMGNTLEIYFGWNKSNPLVQMMGVALHPVQLAIEAVYGSSSCINVKARRASAHGIQ